MKKIYFVGAPTDVKGIHEFNQLAGIFRDAAFYWICYRINRQSRSEYSNIHFLTGLNDVAMSKAVKDMDIFISLSKFEGFCLPIAEALLQNKPVISYRLKEIESVFKNNIEYVPINDIKLFSEKLRDFIYDGIYTKDSTQAKEYIKANFSPEKVAERFLRIISSSHA